MRLSVEINDFLRSWQGVNNAVGSRDDKEYKQLRNQHLRQQMDLAPELQKAKLDYYGLKRGNISAATDLIHHRIRKLNEPTQSPSAIPLPAPAYSTPNSAVPVETPSPGRQSGDTYVPGDMAAVDDYSNEDDSGGGLTQFAASGGAIDDDADDTPNGQVAIPDNDEDDVNEAPETGDEYQVASASGSPGYSMQAAHDAVLDGLKYQVAQMQQRTGAVDTGRYRRTYRDAANDAINPQQMEAIFKAVDPQGKMSVGERGMAAFGHVYSHLINKGDIQGAQKAAGGMLQYYNIQSNKWRAMSRAAAESGDLNGTVKALVKSYENIPDGMDINVVKQGDKLGFEFKDQQTGKTMRKFVASPDEILQAATHGNLPSFEDMIVQTAGRRHQASKGQGGGEPKLGDNLRAYKAIEDEAGQSNPEGKSRYSLPSGMENGVKSIAQDMLHMGLNPRESMDFSQELLKAPFNAFRPEEDGKVKFIYNGREVVLPPQVLAKIGAARGAMAETGTPYGPEQPENNPYTEQRKAFERGATGDW